MLSWSNIRAENEQVVSQRYRQMGICGRAFVACGAMLVLLAWSPALGKERELRALGCFQCHLGETTDNTYLKAQVSLAQLKKRYRPTYLNRVLGAGSTVEGPGISTSHQFNLSASERLSVIASLLEREADKTDGWQTVSSDAKLSSQISLEAKLRCNTCHDNEEIESMAQMAERYRFDYLKSMVGAIGADTSPCEYPHGRLAPEQVTSVLTSMSPVETPTQLKVGAGQASTLHRAQCAACHQSDDMPERFLDMRRMWGHLQPEWLEQFLKTSMPVRRAGVRPGDGRRHPVLSLSDDQVKAVKAALRRLSTKKVSQSTPPALTKDRRDAVKHLIKGRYGCTGCHELDGQGGRIAPGFDGVGKRLRADSIRQVLREPTHYNPDSKMPKWQFVHDGGRLDELVAFLAHLKGSGSEGAYLPWEGLPDPVASQVAGSGSGAALYERHCSDCHGETGKADGYNALFLSPSPMVHWRQSELAHSTDERLIMGIALGGWVLGKSSQMPGFGGMLKPEELRALVQHLRVLCACEGPTWSKDVPQ